MTTQAASSSPLTAIRRTPVWVWTLTALGAIAGALLAESGDFWGNTVPSALTFALAGLVVGLVVWAVVAMVGRSRRA